MKTTGTPEEVFDTASTGKGLYVDALNSGITRLHGSLMMLSSHFDSEGDRLSDEIISAALWGLEGQVNELKKLINLAAGIYPETA